MTSSPKKDDHKKGSSNKQEDIKVEDDLTQRITELTNLEKELITSEEKIKKAELKVAEMTDSYKRVLADLDNFRRRSESEKSEYIKYANKNFLLEILPCLDHFIKAASYIPVEMKKENWVQGITHSITHFENTLKKQGVEPIKAIGEKLDPNLHDAVLQGSGKKDIILEELEKGYTHHGKIIKHARVKVGNGE